MFKQSTLLLLLAAFLFAFEPTSCNSDLESEVETFTEGIIENGANGGVILNNPCSSRPCDQRQSCVDQGDGSYTCECNTVCPQIYQPVCGTNNQTYSNSCELVVDACQTGKDIEKKSDGPCSASPTRPLPTKISPGLGLPKPTTRRPSFRPLPTVISPGIPRPKPTFPPQITACNGQHAPGPVILPQ